MILGAPNRSAGAWLIHLGKKLGFLICSDSLLAWKSPAAQDEAVVDMLEAKWDD